MWGKMLNVEKSRIDKVFGNSKLQPVIMALKEYGFNIHVAAVALLGEGVDLEDAEKARGKLEKKFGIDITFGTTRTPAIWGKHKLSGVMRKGDKSEIHSQPIKKFKPFTEKETAEIQKTINLSREDANIIADRLIEKFGEN